MDIHFYSEHLMSGSEFKSAFTPLSPLRRSVQDSGAAGEMSVAQARGAVRSDQHGRRRGGDELHAKIINIKERKEKSQVIKIIKT